jgi:multiple sugar transport system permease protein
MYSTGAAIVATALGAVTAYAFARTKFRGNGSISYIILLVSSVASGTAAIIPVYYMFTVTKLYDTYQGMFLIFSAGAIPTVLFIMKDFIQSIPKSYEESARLMGAKPMRILWDIVAPIARPGIAFVAIWTFRGVYANFLTPYLLLQNNAKLPASTLLFSFITAGGEAQVGTLSAFSLIFAIPMVVIFLLVNRKYGFSFGGGLKG